jgi:hypothetical protein
MVDRGISRSAQNGGGLYCEKAGGNAFRICRICSVPVRQQPPIHLIPAACHCRAMGKQAAERIER